MADNTNNKLIGFGFKMLIGVFVLGLIIGAFNLHAIWAIIPGAAVGAVGLAAFNESSRNLTRNAPEPVGQMGKEKWIVFAIAGGAIAFFSSKII